MEKHQLKKKAKEKKRNPIYCICPGSHFLFQPVSFREVDWILGNNLGFPKLLLLFTLLLLVGKLFSIFFTLLRLSLCAVHLLWNDFSFNPSIPPAISFIFLLNLDKTFYLPFTLKNYQVLYIFFFMFTFNLSWQNLYVTL